MSNAAPSSSSSRRIIISGGPGSGKTTLIDALHARGHACRAEVSRQLIREQHACGGALLPWRDLPGFAAECERRMRAQLGETGVRGLVFFDRGLPDIVAYLHHAGLPPPSGLFDEARAYTPLVFLAPPWPAIFTQDPERPQTYLDAVALHAELERAYRDCGFEIVPLPRADVATRVAFVERKLAAAPAASLLP